MYSKVIQKTEFLFYFFEETMPLGGAASSPSSRPGLMLED
jgi:hypothetical protein